MSIAIFHPRSEHYIYNKYWKSIDVIKLPQPEWRSHWIDMVENIKGADENEKNFLFREHILGRKNLKGVKKFFGVVFISKKCLFKKSTLTMSRNMLRQFNTAHMLF